MVKFQAGLKAQAVIFDFDGVIVDTEPLHYRAFQQILEPLGLGFTWLQYVEKYMGFDDRDAFNEAFKANGRTLEQSDLNRLIATKAEIFQIVIQDGITAYPGVVELIRALHSAKVPLAICSGALHSDINPILGKLGITDCFDIIVTADDVSRSKPDPESYQLAFDKLRVHRPHAGLEACETIAIEDTPAGICSASQAGLQVVAVTNSYDREHLNKANCIVDSLEQLLLFESE